MNTVYQDFKISPSGIFMVGAIVFWYGSYPFTLKYSLVVETDFTALAAFGTALLV